MIQKTSKESNFNLEDNMLQTIIENEEDNVLFKKYKMNFDNLLFVIHENKNRIIKDENKILDAYIDVLISLKLIKRRFRLSEESINNLTQEKILEWIEWYK